MSNIFQVITTNSPKLLLFFTTVILYFVLSNYEKHYTVASTISKCAPILSLGIFILLQNSEFRTTYKRKILFGLVFSALGDALLNYGMFPQGMAAFGVAQVCYTSAFSFTKPLKLPVAAILYSLGTIGVVLFKENLSGVLLYGLPIYTVLLLTTCWRAIARVESLKSTNDTIRLLGAVGTLFFVISDSIIGFNLFYMKVPNAQFLIMVTYYIAQFFIALTIVDSTGDEEKSQYSRSNYNGNGVPYTEQKIE